MNCLTRKILPIAANPGTIIAQGVFTQPTTSIILKAGIKLTTLGKKDIASNVKNNTSLPLNFIREYPYAVMDITITTNNVCVIAINKELPIHFTMGAVEVSENIAK